MPIDDTMRIVALLSFMLVPLSHAAPIEHKATIGALLRSHDFSAFLLRLLWSRYLRSKLSA